MDWADLGGNVLDNREDNLIIGPAVSNLVEHAGNPKITQPPHAVLAGPSAAAVNKPVALDASGSTDPAGKKLVFRWRFDDGSPPEFNPAVTHSFKTPGFFRVGVTVTNGRYSDLAFRDFRVFDDIRRIGTEGQAADWDFEEVSRREGLASGGALLQPRRACRQGPGLQDQDRVQRRQAVLPGGRRFGARAGDAVA